MPDPTETFENIEDGDEKAADVAPFTDDEDDVFAETDDDALLQDTRHDELRLDLPPS